MLRSENKHPVLNGHLQEHHEISFMPCAIINATSISKAFYQICWDFGDGFFRNDRLQKLRDHLYAWESVWRVSASQRVRSANYLGCFVIKRHKGGIAKSRQSVLNRWNLQFKFDQSIQQIQHFLYRLWMDQLLRIDQSYTVASPLTGDVSIWESVFTPFTDSLRFSMNPMNCAYASDAWNSSRSSRVRIRFCGTVKDIASKARQALPTLTLEI